PSFPTRRSSDLRGRQRLHMTRVLPTVLPCAGITRIRFKGSTDRFRPLSRAHPAPPVQARCLPPYSRTMPASLFSCFADRFQSKRLDNGCQGLHSRLMASSHCRTSRGGSSDLTVAPG